MRLAKYFLALVTGVALAAACGSDEGETSGSGSGGSGGGEAGLDSSFGGTGGSDPGCTAPNCTTCQGCFLKCMCQQNNANACLSQCQGSGGSGGIGGAGGTSAGGTSAGGSSSGGTSAGGSSAGGTGGGSCNPAFCPSSGFGMACCVTPNGPCGTNMGMGCMQSSGGG